jgi:hypothetical protein
LRLLDKLVERHFPGATQLITIRKHVRDKSVASTGDDLTRDDPAHEQSARLVVRDLQEGGNDCHRNVFISCQHGDAST